MERFPGLTVHGFSCSNDASTLGSEAASDNIGSNHKLQTQRSLLSELLAIHACEEDQGLSDDDSNSDSEDDDACHEPEPVVRQESQGLGSEKSEPIRIPVSESFANQRAKDAYRRMMYQRQVEALHHQQQQQLAYQQQQQHLLRQQQMQVQQAQRAQLQLQQQLLAQQRQAQAGGAMGAQ
ncbi:hypothetical protein HYH03_005838 [Edaphochlamys debaryana]|uniref:Uncharacterized protein n=1 Tax=Edaphochlamys debaryana TaxID=47281 RepID=A0A836C103_9CHLO|nr:hypothetical protein HYH03_005838 [Edaphochlamys debaryana]|eukprot:KAG2496240.1 hypothetical protein HYH03_005838 [Edaphochlamys debaryana]